MDAVRIGCRMRSNSYLAQYGDEFTIRAKLPSGAKTELTKIIEGWGDYFFYGFANAEETDIERWTLADLNVFRLWFSRQIARNGGRTPGIARGNRDGSSNFVVFRWDELPPEFIIDSSERRAAA